MNPPLAEKSPRVRKGGRRGKGRKVRSFHQIAYEADKRDEKKKVNTYYLDVVFWDLLKGKRGKENKEEGRSCFYLVKKGGEERMADAVFSDSIKSKRRKDGRKGTRRGCASISSS